MVRRRDGVLLARPAGRMLAPAVCEPRGDPWLVVRDPVPDSVAEAVRDRAHVFAVGVDGRAGRPTARVLERLREIPVVEGHERRDPCLEQRIDDTFVEVEPRHVDLPATLWK